MSDLFLRAASESDLQVALATMGMWNETGGYVPSGILPEGGGAFALDVVGIVRKPQKDADGNPATTTSPLLGDDGNPVTVTNPETGETSTIMGPPLEIMVPVEGFHANLRWVSDLPLSPEVGAIALDPGPHNPVRAFA